MLSNFGLNWRLTVLAFWPRFLGKWEPSGTTNVAVRKVRLNGKTYWVKVTMTPVDGLAHLVAYGMWGATEGPGEYAHFSVYNLDPRFHAKPELRSVNVGSTGPGKLRKAITELQ